MCGHRFISSSFTGVKEQREVATVRFGGDAWGATVGWPSAPRLVQLEEFLPAEASGVRREKSKEEDLLIFRLILMNRVVERNVLVVGPGFMSGGTSSMPAMATGRILTPLTLVHPSKAHASPKARLLKPKACRSKEMKKKGEASNDRTGHRTSAMGKQRKGSFI